VRRMLGAAGRRVAAVHRECGLRALASRRPASSNVGDIFHQQRRLWVRLHEKGGKFHEMPCHHTLEG